MGKRAGLKVAAQRKVFPVTELEFLPSAACPFTSPSYPFCIHFVALNTPLFVRSSCKANAYNLLFPETEIEVGRTDLRVVARYGRFVLEYVLAVCHLQGANILI